MTASLFTALFLVALASATLLRLWLGARQTAHVAAHRVQVPADFASRISLEEHQRAADYTLAKGRLVRVDILLDATFLLLLTLGGGLAWLDQATGWLAGDAHLRGLLLFGAASVLGFLVGLPTTLYRTFGIEARFGFNTTTPRLWLADLVKSTLLSVAIAAPLLYAVLWLMEAMGALWWLYVWFLWLGVNLLAMVIYPTVIAPLFNTFTPLPDPALQQRIEGLLQRCGFAASGVFVMDGSRRSAHGNAYFTGFGRAKRIVFFDTLLQRLSPEQIEAVLAHELGHYRHGHIAQRLGLAALLTLVLLWVLGALMQEPWFYAGVGVPEVDGSRTAMALLIFSLVLPVFLFPLAPLTSALSRRHEYQADAYAARQTSAATLVEALVRLYRDNAATLTPDPLHSLFHDSHPPARLRVAHLRSLEGQPA